MNSHNLQMQIQAMAVMVRVDGMKAYNASRLSRNECPAYEESDFEHKACELDGIIEKIYHEQYSQ